MNFFIIELINLFVDNMCILILVKKIIMMCVNIIML